MSYLIKFNNRIITDLTATSNAFNNYFTSIAEKTNLKPNFKQNIT